MAFCEEADVDALVDVAHSPLILTSVVRLSFFVCSRMAMLWVQLSRDLAGNPAPAHLVQLPVELLVGPPEFSRVPPLLLLLLLLLLLGLRHRRQQRRRRRVHPPGQRLRAPRHLALQSRQRGAQVVAEPDKFSQFPK